MNKLGFYLENTTIPFLRDALRKVQPPVLLIHAGDRGLLREIRNELSPETFVIGRMFVDLPQQNAWLTGPDPGSAGRTFAEKIINYDFGLAKEKGNGGRLLIDAWMSLNEPVRGPASFLDWQPDAETLARYAALDSFQVSFLERLRGEGLEGVAFSFAAGNFVAKDHVVAHFPRSLAAYTYLAFHEYGWPTLMPKADTSTSTTLYRNLLEGIQERHGDKHKVIITEAGLARMYRYPNDPAGDVGWLYRGETISEAQYWESLEWYNAQLSQDGYVMGACLYQVGHSGLWETFRHLGEDNEQRPILLIDKIAGLREVTSPVTPSPTPEPAPLAETDEELLNRVKAVQERMRTAVSQADAFGRDLNKMRTALTTATQTADAGPTTEDVRSLLNRLAALETGLEASPLGSEIDRTQLRSQAAALREQANALLVAAQRLDTARSQVAEAKGRLATLEGRAAEVAKTKQAAGQILAQADSLATEIGAGRGAAIGRAFEAGARQDATGVVGPVARDVRAEMDALATVPAQRRELATIRRILVHHTGADAQATPGQVANRQIKRGRTGIAYHYLVTGDGTVYQTQDIEVIVNQSRVAAVDQDAVAVALGGDFDLAIPSEEQLAAAANLLAALMDQLGLSVNAIYGRNELERGTTSPGAQWGQGVRYRDDLIARVAELRMVHSRFDRR